MSKKTKQPKQPQLSLPSQKKYILFDGENIIDIGTLEKVTDTLDALLNGGDISEQDANRFTCYELGQKLQIFVSNTYSVGIF